MVSTTTTDPWVVFGILVATSGTWLLLALLIKRLVDEPHSYTPATRRVPTADRHPHARPAAPDETQPITTVQLCRARHRKGQPR